MISIASAIQLVKQQSNPIAKETIKPLGKSGGYILYNDIFSPISMPPFRQSAMDGYALNLHDELDYHLIGEIKAGDAQQPILKPGEAVRIFTGAAVPDTANAVMMQEKVTVNSNRITIAHTIDAEINIRQKGEQVKEGSVALKKRHQTHPRCNRVFSIVGHYKSFGVQETKYFHNYHWQRAD